MRCCGEGGRVTAFPPTALLQSQFVVLTEAAHLVNHCQGNLTNYQATCSQQIWAFETGAVEVLNTCVDGEAGGQQGHEQDAWCANY